MENGKLFVSLPSCSRGLRQAILELDQIDERAQELTFFSSLFDLSFSGLICEAVVMYASSSPLSTSELSCAASFLESASFLAFICSLNDISPPFWVEMESSSSRSGSKRQSHSRRSWVWHWVRVSIRKRSRWKRQEREKIREGEEEEEIMSTMTGGKDYGNGKNRRGKRRTSSAGENESDDLLATFD
jgi:hypothetical protein